MPQNTETDEFEPVSEVEAVVLPPPLPARCARAPDRYEPDGESAELAIPPDSLRPYDLNVELKNSLMPPPRRARTGARSSFLAQVGLGFLTVLVGFAGGRFAGPEKASAMATCVPPPSTRVQAAPPAPIAKATEPPPPPTPANALREPVGTAGGHSAPAGLTSPTSPPGTPLKPAPQSQAAPPKAAKKRPRRIQRRAAAPPGPPPGYAPPTASF